jgi:hypothetical protein
VSQKRRGQRLKRLRERTLQTPPAFALLSTLAQRASPLFKLNWGRHARPLVKKRVLTRSIFSMRGRLSPLALAIV